jgi:gas vesicle protein
MQDQVNSDSKSKTTSNAKTMALIFLGGALAGAAAGLLFAPKSGRETRKALQDYANRTKAGLDAAISKGRSMLEKRAA